MSIRTGLIVLAAGTGQRYGGANKVFADLAGRPVLEYSLHAAAAAPSVAVVVVVANTADHEAATAIATRVGAPLRNVVGGGQTRQASEVAGLESLAADIESGAIDVVAIHDAARPFLTADLLERVAAAAAGSGAVPADPPTDAIWQLTTERPVSLDKAALRAAQTPQAFPAGDLLDAYRTAAEDGFIGADTAATVARYSTIDIAFVAGDRRNLKITYRDDVDHAATLVAQWSPTGWIS